MFEPVDASNIKDAIQKVFECEPCLDPDSISLFEILSIFHEIKSDKKRFKDEISCKLDKKIESIDNNFSVIVQEIDDITNEICVVLRNTTNRNRTKIYFGKNNGELIICKIKGYCRINNVLQLMGAYIEELYDYYESLRKVELEEKFHINSVNSPFFVNISYSCLCIYYNKSHITSDFRILSFYDDNLKFYCKSRNESVTAFIKNRENEFLSNIFVKISDCPEWMQKHLILERQVQLEEIEAAQQAELIRQAKLAKKQKRREFWKKIFPFIK